MDKWVAEGFFKTVKTRPNGECTRLDDPFDCILA